MTLSSLINTYGYIGVLIGTFLEGETTLVLAAFAAHQGLMDLPYVIMTASIGSFSGDQLFFFLGRRRRQTTLVKHPSLKARVEKAQRLLERFRTLLMFMFRFMYGLRTVIPFAFGISPVPTLEFVSVSALSSSIWAVLVGLAGYLFGSVVERLIGDIKHYQLLIVGAIVALAIAIWIIRHYRRKTK